MAPFNIHEVADIVTAQIYTPDRQSILVEAGLHEPLLVFLQGGKDRNDGDSDRFGSERAPKRRKVVKNTHIVEQRDAIPLGEITIDLPVIGTPSTPPDDEDIIETPVVLRDVDDRADVDRITLSETKTKVDRILVLSLAGLDSDACAALKKCAGPEFTKGLNVHTAQDRCSTLQAVLRWTPDLGHVSLSASVYWYTDTSPSSGISAKAKYWHDGVIYNRFFPETSTEALADPWRPRDFYDSIHIPNKLSTPDADYDIDAPLFPFQRRTIDWMCKREDIATESGHDGTDSLSLECSMLDADGKKIYHDPLLRTISREPITSQAATVRGGILAEEMGLGKTVEIIALIASHKRPDHRNYDKLLDSSNTMVTPSKATLIITPPSILQQWKMELAQHAPTLKVYHYEGIPSHGKKERSEKLVVDMLSREYDVVLTTYNVLAREVHFTIDPPDRNMRHNRQYERKRSPLVHILWWRICLDEAQMVDSGVTAAARVAQRLPRVYSWAVSGTPVKKNVEDLYGLLIFLRLEPFASNQHAWRRLLASHKGLFKKLFGSIAIRHTKAQIRDELQLPPQKRIVMNLPFTAIENQHYTTMFKDMCAEIGVNLDGSPLLEDWSPEDPRVVENMRIWLTRLRQTCLHPQIGGRNRRRLGKGPSPLRTVTEVLDAMIEQNETMLRADERLSIQAELRSGHIIGNAKDMERRAEKSLETYLSAQLKCEEIVEAARIRIQGIVELGVHESDVEDEDSETGPVMGRLRNSLRSALQLLHVCVYFAATANYQIKANITLTAPDSDDFTKLEEKETQLYDRAKLIRREVLHDAARSAEKAMQKIKEQRSDPIQLPEITDLQAIGGIESRRIVQNSYELFDLIREIAPKMVEWREKMIDILLMPLVDEDGEGNEITGEEYELSTKQQDELYAYFDSFKALHADLTRCITGETAPLIDHEAKNLLKNAKNFLDPEVNEEMKVFVHAPELTVTLFTIRKDIRSKLDNLTSIRDLIAQARALQDPGQVSGRAEVEGRIAQQISRSLQSVLSGYTKALNGLEQEVELFRVTQNVRLEFYRQMQELSDDVAPYKEELDEELDMVALNNALHTMDHHNTVVARARTKLRFLLHLKEESGSKDTARICVICQCPFDNGVLTVCGHQYCKECIQAWWQQHRTCPVCKRRLAMVDFHNITYKPQELKIQEEDQSASSSPGASASTSPSSLQASIYSEVDSKLMDQIKSYDLTSSYGTKIDTLARHLLWLRDHDPGAKAIVFSQYREFLDVLSTAFYEFKIGHTRLGKANAVEQFRKEARIDCLLLDAKTDSSGLTLVNATHVFICEPLVQTAVELQAIARVHRIGQTRPTTVWMYLVNDTVEECIYEISVRRRLEHVKAKQPLSSSAASRSSTPAIGEQAIDAANTEELQSAQLSKLLASGKGGGEMVGKDDLWQCLFGNAQNKQPVDPAMQQDLDREVRARAAERRAAEHAM